MGDQGKAGDVGGDHPFPVLGVALLRALDAQRQAGVVYQDIDRQRGLIDLPDCLVQRCLVAYIQRQRDEVFAKLLPQLHEFVHAACAADDPVTFGDQLATDGFAKTGRCAGHKCGFHAVFPFISSSGQVFRSHESRVLPAQCG
ncbi:hypothetical protein D3C79_801950 [compost metagenome]